MKLFFCYDKSGSMELELAGRTRKEQVQRVINLFGENDQNTYEAIFFCPFDEKIEIQQSNNYHHIVHDSCGGTEIEYCLTMIFNFLLTEHQDPQHKVLVFITDADDKIQNKQQISALWEEVKLSTHTEAVFILINDNENETSKYLSELFESFRRIGGGDLEETIKDVLKIFHLDPAIDHKTEQVRIVEEKVKEANISKEEEDIASAKIISAIEEMEKNIIDARELIENSKKINEAAFNDIADRLDIDNMEEICKEVSKFAENVNQRYQQVNSLLQSFDNLNPFFLDKKINELISLNDEIEAVYNDLTSFEHHLMSKYGLQKTAISQLGNLKQKAKSLYDAYVGSTIKNLVKRMDSTLASLNFKPLQKLLISLSKSKSNHDQQKKKLLSEKKRLDHLRSVVNAKLDEIKTIIGDDA